MSRGRWSLKRVFLILLGVTLQLLASCSLPITSGVRSGQLSLTLELTQPAFNPTSSSTRLLLSNAKTVKVQSLANGKEVFASDATISGAKATVQIPLDAGVEYTIRASAFDASNVLVYSGQTSVTLTAAASTILYLLPVRPDGTLWQTTLAAADQPVDQGSGAVTDLAPGATSTFLLDFSQIASSFRFSPIPSGVSVYLQTPTGQPVALSTVDPVIAASDLGKLQSLWVTFQNASGAAASASMSPVGTFAIPVTAIVVSFPSYVATGATVPVSWPPTSFTPKNTTSRLASDFSWTSSEPAVLKVDASGKLTAGDSPGSATISVKSNSTSLVVASAKIRVLPPPNVTMEPVAPFLTALPLTVSGTADGGTNGTIQKLYFLVDSAAADHSTDNPATWNLATLGGVDGEQTRPWTVTVTGLAEGPLTIWVQPLDGTGRFAPLPATQGFVYDATDPSVVVTTPSPDDTLVDTKLTVTGTASDNLELATVEYKLDSADWLPATGLASWTLNLTGLNEGAHSITIRATDAAGRVGQSTVSLTMQNSATISFGMDAYQTLTFSPSTLSISKGDQPTITSSNTSLTTSGTNWDWWIDNVAVGTGSSLTLPATLSVGTHTLSVFVTYGGVDYSGTLQVAVLP